MIVENALAHTHMRDHGGQMKWHSINYFLVLLVLNVCLEIDEEESKKKCTTDGCKCVIVNHVTYEIQSVEKEC